MQLSFNDYVFAEAFLSDSLGEGGVDELGWQDGGQSPAWASVQGEEVSRLKLVTVPV